MRQKDRNISYWTKSNEQTVGAKFQEQKLWTSEFVSQIYDLAQSLETKIIEQNTFNKTWKHKFKTKNGNKIQKRLKGSLCC